MPISVKNDIKPMFGFGNTFSLRQTPFFMMGSYLNFVRSAAANRNYDQFHRSWDIIDAKRDVTKAMASKFNLKRPEDDGIFDQLWHIIRDAQAYNKDVKEDIKVDLEEAYEFVAILASGGSLPGSPRTWARTISRSDQNFVIFSDHHMTTFEDITLPNYFKDYNYELYRDVLNHYADRQYCLVENGDVEECIIYEPTLNDATARKQAAAQFPIRLSDSDWYTFVQLRYGKREENLDNIIDAFSQYYDLIRSRFITQNRYVRLTGNHDTYLTGQREGVLRDRIEDELGVQVYDVLKINRNGSPAYLVLHGHQFDTVSIQHGSVPYAKSLGEVYSEAMSWIYQGPDRFWTTSDTKKWYHGTIFRNFLAREEPGEYHDGGDGMYDLVMGNRERIKEDPKHFVETLLGHEIAWEYFENSDGFNALTLEVWEGDEWFKFRHLHERNLCQRYASNYLNIVGPPFNVPIPKLVLGHTHEPRQNAVNPTNGDEAYYYLNSGSAGRFENLIWCVEINGDVDKIVSWSRVDGRLKKITWRSEHTEVTVEHPYPVGEVTTHTSNLVHDTIHWY